MRFKKDTRFFRLNAASIIISSAFISFLFFNLERSRVAIASNQIIDEIMNSEKSRFEKIVSFVFEETLSINTTSNVSEKILKRILLSDNLKLFITFKLNVDEKILQTFNTIINFVFNNKNYAVAICVCVKIKSVLQYKTNNTHLRLNKLMTIIAKLRIIHKEKDDEIICLTH